MLLRAIGLTECAVEASGKIALIAALVLLPLNLFAVVILGLTGQYVLALLEMLRLLLRGELLVAIVVAAMVSLELLRHVRARSFARPR